MDRSDCVPRSSAARHCKYLQCRAVTAKARIDQFQFHESAEQFSSHPALTTQSYKHCGTGLVYSWVNHRSMMIDSVILNLWFVGIKGLLAELGSRTRESLQQTDAGWRPRSAGRAGVNCRTGAALPPAGLPSPRPTIAPPTPPSGLARQTRSSTWSCELC